MVLLEAEFFRGAAAGVEPPQVNGQSPAHRHDRLLPGRARGLGIGQHGPPFLQGWIVRLEPHAPPRQFNQGGAQPPVAVFGDGTVPAFVAAGPHARTHPRQTGHLPPIRKPPPVQNLARQHLAGQRARTVGLGGGGLLQPLRGRVQLRLHRQQQIARDRQQFQQTGGNLPGQLLPLPR